MAADIVRLLARRTDDPGAASAPLRPVHPGDIAVLCRTNVQARTVQEALHALRVPAVLSGDRSVFESGEARDLLTVLSAAADPTSAKRVRAALATSLIGLNAESPLRDRRARRGMGPPRCPLRRMERRLDPPRLHANDATDSRRRAASADERSPSALLGLPQGERRLTNVLHLAELLHEAALSGHRGPHELIDWLRREIDDAGVVGRARARRGADPARERRRGRGADDHPQGEGARVAVRLLSVSLGEVGALR